LISSIGSQPSPLDNLISSIGSQSSLLIT
jgi:hypothetical protein